MYIGQHGPSTSELGARAVEQQASRLNRAETTHVPFSATTQFALPSSWYMSRASSHYSWPDATSSLPCAAVERPKPKWPCINWQQGTPTHHYGSHSVESRSRLLTTGGTSLQLLFFPRLLHRAGQYSPLSLCLWGCIFLLLATTLYTHTLLGTPPCVRAKILMI